MIFSQNCIRVLELKRRPITVGSSVYNTTMKKNTVIKKEVNMEEITKKLIILLGEFDDYYHNKFLPLYGPGGIYHVPRKHKGLRLDNVEDLEEKGQNVN